MDFSHDAQILIGAQRTGGSYRITAEAKAYLEQNRIELFEKRTRLTLWLVDQRYQGVNDPEITVEVVRSTEQGRQESVEQRAFDLLRHLALDGDIGHHYKLRDDRALARKNIEILKQRSSNIFMFADYARSLAASGCDDWQELGVYMDQLRESGHVRMTPVSNELGWNHYSVTFQGYQAAKGNPHQFLATSPAASAIQTSATGPSRNKKEVFVIHGRNENARAAIFDFLNAVGLEPIEWETAVQATESAAPYIGQILDAALDRSNAVIAVLTPDDNVVLQDWLQRGDDPDNEKTPVGQPRPNVIFETGMAMAKFQESTIVVEIGSPKKFSDLAGRHTVRMTDTVHCRNTLAQRLETAGCPVDRSRPNWEEAGDFHRAISSASSRQDAQVPDSATAASAVERDIVDNHLNSKAKELLAKAASGQGDFQGFIDDYRYTAGGVPIEVPNAPRAKAEFEEAIEQLTRNELARRLVPQHMQGRRGLQLTERGYRAAGHLGKVQSSQNWRS